MSCYFWFDKIKTWNCNSEDFTSSLAQLLWDSFGFDSFEQLLWNNFHCIREFIVYSCYFRIVVKRQTSQLNMILFVHVLCVYLQATTRCKDRNVSGELKIAIEISNHSLWSDMGIEKCFFFLRLRWKHFFEINLVFFFFLRKLPTIRNRFVVSFSLCSTTMWSSICMQKKHEKK